MFEQDKKDHKSTKKVDTSDDNKDEKPKSVEFWPPIGRKRPMLEMPEGEYGQSGTGMGNWRDRAEKGLEREH